MKVLCLSLCLLVLGLAALCDARPSSKRSFGKAKRDFDSLFDVDDDDLQALADAVSKDLGHPVSAQDVEDFMEAHEDEIKAALAAAVAELKPEELEEIEDLMDQPEVLEHIMDQLAEQGHLKRKKKGMKSRGKDGGSSDSDKNPFDQLLDMDDDDLEAVAEAVSNDLGYPVSAQDVEDFVEEHEDDIREALSIAIAELDPEHVDEIEEFLASPDLLGNVLDQLEEKGHVERKKGKGSKDKNPFDQLLDMDDDDLEAVAEAVSEDLGYPVSAQDVEDFVKENEDDIREALSIAIAELDPEHMEEIEEFLASPDLLGNVLDQLQEMGHVERKKKGMGSKSKKSLDQLLDMDDDDLEAVAAAVSEDLGYPVSAQDVEDFIDEHGDDIKEALSIAIAELDAEHMDEIEEFLASPDLVGKVMEQLAEMGHLKRKRKGMGSKSKKSLDQLLDMDDEDLEAVAAAVSEDLGYPVSAQDVEDFIDEHGDDIKEALSIAIAELDAEHMDEIEEFLASPDLVGKVMEQLAEMGHLERKRKEESNDDDENPLGQLLDMDDEDLEAVAEAVSEDLGYSVSAQDVEDFVEEHEDEITEALSIAVAELDAEHMEEIEELLAHPDLLGHILGQLEQMGLLERKEKGSKGSSGESKDDDERKNHFDALLEMDDDKIDALAAEVSEQMGHPVDSQDVADFMNAYEKEVEEAFYVAAAELDHKDFEEFEDLLAHPDLLGDILDHLEQKGLLKRRK